MKIAVTGSSGVLGSVLVPALRSDGHEVIRLVRRTPQTGDEHRWDPQHRRIDPSILRDVDGVVNLAGASMKPRVWTRSYEQRMLASRVDSTATISAALSAAAVEEPERRRVLLSGSGVSFYGDTGDRVVTEDDPPGDGFMAHLCVEWEGATAPAAEAGVRVALLRTGLVLAPDGPLMQVVGPIFRLALGGRIGSGRQYWPWISLADQIGAMRHLLTADVSGPVNLTSPTPVTNAEFTQVLGEVLHRPTVLPVPGFPLTVALRDFGRVNVVGGQRALPTRLEDSGYRFADTDLAAALRAAIARP
ncbi:TIGR01777 family oxidoreductase [Blastococcus sp. SYSU DS0973]